MFIFSRNKIIIKRKKKEIILKDFEKKYVLTNLPFAQKLLGLKNKISNPELGIKLAKAYYRTKNIPLANKTIDSLIKIKPQQKELISIKKTFLL